MPSFGICFLCGREGSVEYHHVFGGALRDKSTEYGFVVPLCGETCHRLGKKSAHGCRKTSDRLKAHFQSVYMVKYHASVAEWRIEWYKNYIDLSKIEDERKYPMNISVKSGRLVADPELRHTSTGIPVTSFRIAVRRPGTKTDEVDFFNCTCWRGTAEFVCKFFEKGKWIEVSGWDKFDEYEKNGEKQRAHVIEVERVFFGGSGKYDKDFENGDQEPTAQSRFTEEKEVDDGELPF